MSLLFKKIEKLTLSGKLDWVPTEKYDVFQTSFPNFSLRIYPQADDYVISIFNSEGVELESATDEELSNFLNESYSKMRSLHAAARGYSLGVEQALDEILTELDEKDNLPL